MRVKEPTCERRAWPKQLPKCQTQVTILKLILVFIKTTKITSRVIQILVKSEKTKILLTQNCI